MVSRTVVTGLAKARAEGGGGLTRNPVGHALCRPCSLCRKGCPASHAERASAGVYDHQATCCALSSLASASEEGKGWEVSACCLAATHAYRMDVAWQAKQMTN